jgi:DNA polymerase sigma
VTDDFTVKMPAIKFVTSNGLECELSLSNHQAYQTSALLADYITLDPR